MRTQLKILHLFQWQLKDITNTLDKVKEQGFNAIQISPIQECRQGEEWWKLYQNTSYKIGNHLGTEDDLKELCEKANKLNIDIIADVLFHNVASLDGNDIHPDVDKELAKYVIKDLPSCSDYEDRYQTTHLRVGLPMVNYFDNDLQVMQFDMLENLYKIGVKAFRIDMAKHFALPNEGCSYFTKVFLPFIEKGMFVYGEVLNSDQNVIDAYANIMSVCTDRRTTDKTKQIAFFESHDTFHTFKTTVNMTKEQMFNEWNKLINVEKVSSIFFARPFDDTWMSEEIKHINLGSD